MTDLATLRRVLSDNRFMPVPPPELIFCGDGDFRAIGAEFLEHLVNDAGLRPSHRVLEIGSGVGRMALPLTQFLDQSGSYHGIDPVRAGIEWCSKTITTAYPNVDFHHLDLRHPLYNPDGTLETSDTALPFGDGSFDIICMISVLTHLDLPEVLHYAGEIRRLLSPGGCCFATAFLMNQPACVGLSAGLGRMEFDPEQVGPVYYANPDTPLAAVAFDEDAMLEKFLRHGLKRRPPARYGHWSGRPAPNFQDICIFEVG